MSSHREAPSISKDPVADNTDLYVFVAPADTSKVTILANFIPLEEPAGGPNFFQFGDDVLYEILIDNDGDGVEDVTYQFRFKSTTQNPATFLYNTGPISSLTDPNWNVRQLYSVTKVLGPRRTGATSVLGADLPTPPVRIGPRSTPDYAALAGAAANDPRAGARRVAGPWVQVSRLGEPLINEVVIELGEKDLWNSRTPAGDLQFVDDYAQPGLQTLLPILYPGVFPNLAALAKSGKTRADLIAILLTGIPPGVLDGFQNSNGPTQADELRLNLAFAPSYDATDSGINPPGDSNKRFGILRAFTADGVPDLDGFPNGRRVFDNVTAIELRAIAGLTFPLVDNTFNPDGAAGLLMDGTKEDLPFLPTFPYLALPYEGFEHEHDPEDE